VEVEARTGLIARAQDKLRFVDEALTRLDAGKYGRCVGCHELIPLDRLKALPFAVYCVDCQQKRNRSSSGWGEGTMISPYDHQWTVPEEMEEPTEREYRNTDPEDNSPLIEERSDLASRNRQRRASCRLRNPRSELGPTKSKHR
jgi:hypothetical protein